MTRRLAFISLGAIAGAIVSALAWREAQAELLAGANVAGVGFGMSHLLFVVSVPWSVTVWLVMAVKVLITGTDGTVSLGPFYAMPIVAGAGWGWLASVAARRLQRTADRPRS